MKKKYLLFIVSGLLIGILFSCKQNIKFYEEDYFFSENSINKSYYKKDGKSLFYDFMKAPEEKALAVNAARKARNAASDEVISEEEMFSQLWLGLTEDDKDFLSKNIEDTAVNFDSLIMVEKESPIGRSVINGDTAELDYLARYYGFIAFISDITQDKLLPVTFLEDSFEIDKTQEFSAAPVLEMSIRAEDWNKVRDILLYIDKFKEFDNLKNTWAELNSFWKKSNTQQARSSSLNGMGSRTSLFDGLGDTLLDGDILLTNGKKKAYAIVGDWSHGGIFSKKRYEENGAEDSSRCVYTAQPSKDMFSDFSNSSFAEYDDMKVDRYGFACLEPINAYTKMHKFAVLRPKDYTTSKGAAAVNTAKTVYYDTKAKYFLPIYEAAFNKPSNFLQWIFAPVYSGVSCMLDSSHDLTAKNTYCTKVVYTAWKKNGVDIDANVFAGNLVSPDDIYASSVNRYVTLTVKVLWWKYKKSWKVYGATTNLVRKISR